MAARAGEGFLTGSVSRRPRIAHIITKGAPMGGSQRDLLNNVRGLVGLWDVEVIVGGSGPLEDACHELGARTAVVPMSNSLAAPWSDVRSVFRLIRHLRLTRPDIVHTHASKAGVLGRFAARLSGVPVVVHSVVTPPGGDRSLPLRWAVTLMERVSSRFTDHIQCVSRLLAAELSARGVMASARVSVAPSVVDPPLSSEIAAGRRDRVRQSLGLDADSPVVLTVAELAPCKQHQVLLAAAKIVLETYPDTVFLLAGSGKLQRKLECLVGELGIATSVRFLGARKDVPDLLLASDIYVQSSRREGVSRSLVEAMSYSLAAVATDVGGTREIVEDSVTGLLAPPGDVAALAANILGLLLHPERRRRMGRAAALAVAGRHDARPVQRRTVELYEELLAAKVDTHAGIRLPWLPSDLRVGRRAMRSMYRRRSIEGPFSFRRAATSTRGSTSIAFVVDSLNVGGTERHLVRLCEGLMRAADWSVTVHCLNRQGAYLDRVVALGIPVSGRQVRWSRYRAPLWLFGLIRYFVATRPDIAHCYLNTAGLLGAVAARLCGVPHVITTRRSVHDFSGPKLLAYRACARLMDRLSDRVIAVSDASRSQAVAEGTPAQKVLTIPNAVETQPVLGSLSEPGGEPLIVCVGTLRDIKGHRWLVDAMPDVVARHPRAVLAVVGEGPDREELQRICVRLGLSGHVRFLGVRHDVPELLAAADIFVLPSLVEGMPNALLEAMAQGVPVVATRVGGVPEAVTDEVSGLLVEPGSAEALATAIDRLAARPDLRRRLAAAALSEVSARFSAASELRAVEAVYRELLRCSGRPAVPLSTRQ